jgi:hypothetical protein
MSRAKAFNRDRDAALRSLDRGQFEQFQKKWNLPRPREWIDDAWLASMHKARLQINTFTQTEKAISRLWLARNGFTEQVGTKMPCPACGNMAPSQTACIVCGTAP